MHNLLYKLRSVHNTGTCTDLNLFYSIHFLFFLFPCGFSWELCRTAIMHSASAIVHCKQNEAGQQTIKAPSMPCWGAFSPWKHSLAFMPQDWWNWLIKWIKSVSMGSYQYKNQVNEAFFLHTLWVTLLYFSLESRQIPALLELGQVKLFWKLIRSIIWQLSHSCQTGVWEYFPSSLALR